MLVMSAQRPLYLGPRLRRLRRELGLTQQTMAAELAISPSYVALLERNQRPLTADLLLRLARTYKLDLDDLGTDDSQSLTTRLQGVLRDPIFADIDLPALEIADLATSFPGVSEALLRLHGAYTKEQQALAEQRVRGEDGTEDAVSEARRFFIAARNHFPELEAAADTIGAEIADKGSPADWLKARGIRVRMMPPDVMMGTIRRYDRHAEQVLIDDTLTPESRAYQVALQIAYIAFRSQISSIVREAGLTSETAMHLVRRALGAYGAAALLMPYDKFAKAVEARHYDVEAIARAFGTSFEQTAHRLTTLNRPGQERVPFFFLRVDQAGNVSKRLDGAGFPFAAHGGGCPLWSVHTVFRTPRQVVTQWLELPDGQRFFSIARTVTAGGGGWGRPRVLRSVALACAAEHAGKLIYTKGLNLADVEPTPIGVTCRLCNRAQCTARAVPPIGREILPDDYRRPAEPFAFDEA